MLAMAFLIAPTAAETLYTIDERWQVGALDLDAGLRLEPAAVAATPMDDAAFMAVVCARDGRPALYLYWPAAVEFDGITTEIAIRVDGGAPFTFDARAVAMTLETPSSPPSGLLKALAAGDVADVTADRVPVMRVGLRGSAVALGRALRACS